MKMFNAIRFELKPKLIQIGFNWIQVGLNSIQVAFDVIQYFHSQGT